MKYGFFKNKLGIIKISYDKKIKRIEIVDKIDEKSSEDEIFLLFKNQILEYLKGHRKSFDHLDLLDFQGSDFQKSVWKALLEITYGKTISYKDLAKMIGRPKASRAVGTAVGKNPFLIIVPCHRVIKSNGSIGGFAYGKQTKRRLLEDEGINFPFIEESLIFPKAKSKIFLMKTIKSLR